MKSDKGNFLKVFVSSTFSDLRDLRSKLIDKLNESLTISAMEIFIPKGLRSQEIIASELESSDIILFLISSHYGTFIDTCYLEKKCLSNCGFKKGEKISYTHCEYRYSKSIERKHSSYKILDGGWLKIEEDKNHPSNLFLKEIEDLENCAYIAIDNAQRILHDLAHNIVEWYNESKLTFGRFCGRAKEIKKLFNKINNNSLVELIGVGGVGKTTVCEIILLIFNLLGKKIYYLGHDEIHSSGTGFDYFNNEILQYRTKRITINDIIKCIGLPEYCTDLAANEKRNLIVNHLDKNAGSILYIDNIKKNKHLFDFIKKCKSRLTRSCILISSKTDFNITSERLQIENIQEEEAQNDLLDIFFNKLGFSKDIPFNVRNKIKRLAEGHPVATYLFVSNYNRIDFNIIQRFRESCNFSKDSDVKEYLNRVIREGLLSKEAYLLSQGLSLIEEELDYDYIFRASKSFFPELANNDIEDLFNELIDAFLMSRNNGKLLWSLSQINEILQNDIKELNKLAINYYQILELESYHVNFEIKKNIHLLRFGSLLNIADRFFEITPLTTTLEDYQNISTIQNLIDLGEELVKLENREQKAKVNFILGNLYSKITEMGFKGESYYYKKALKKYTQSLEYYSLKTNYAQNAIIRNSIANSYRKIAEIENRSKNCKKALDILRKGINDFPKSKYLEQYAMFRLNMGSTFQTLAIIEDRKINCRKAIKALEESLAFYIASKSPNQFAMIQNNLGNAYQTLAEVNNRVVYSKKAILAFSKSLKYYTIEKLPLDFAMTNNNIGTAYHILFDINQEEKYYKLALKAYKNALKIWKKNRFPLHYAQVQGNLSSLYSSYMSLDDNLDVCKLARDSALQSIKIFTKENSLYKYSQQKLNLGKAYLNLSSHVRTKENLMSAKKALDEALQFFTEENYPLLFGNLRIILGSYYRELAKLEENEMRFNDAISEYNYALRIFTKEEYPIQFVKINLNLGNVYAALARFKNTVKYCLKAKECLTMAKHVIGEDYPKLLQIILDSIKNITVNCNKMESK